MVPNGALGAYVASVVSGSPAEKAGIKAQDVIQSVDGTKIDASHTLADLIGAKKVGDTVTLSVLAGGAGTAKDVKVTLAKNPDKDAPYLGVEYTLRGARGIFPGIPGQNAVAGAFVSQVAENSPAAKADIEAGDVITKIAGTAVTDPQQVVDAVGKLKPGDTIALSVSDRDSGKVRDVTVPLDKSPSDATKAYLGLTLTSGMGLGGRGFGGQRFQQVNPPAQQPNDGLGAGQVGQAQPSI
jgi:serine protease Do